MGLLGTFWLLTPDISFATIFYHSVGCLSILLTVFREISFHYGGHHLSKLFCVISGKKNSMKTTGSKQHTRVASGGFPRRSWPGLLNLWASATEPQFYQEGQVNNLYLISF